MSKIQNHGMISIGGGGINGPTSRAPFAVDETTDNLGRKDIYASTSGGEVRSLVISTATIDSSFDSNIWVFMVSDETGDANANNIVLTTEGSQTFDGVASVSITEDYGSVTLYAAGGNLFSVT